MIRLLFDDINKPIIKQYLDMYMKSAAYNLSNSCDSKIVSRNSHLREKSISGVLNAVNLVIFAAKTMSGARKEIMGLFYF